MNDNIYKYIRNKDMKNHLIEYHQYNDTDVQIDLIIRGYISIDKKIELLKAFKKDSKRAAQLMHSYKKCLKYIKNLENNHTLYVLYGVYEYFDDNYSFHTESNYIDHYNNYKEIIDDISSWWNPDTDRFYKVFRVTVISYEGKKNGFKDICSFEINPRKLDEIIYIQPYSYICDNMYDIISSNEWYTYPYNNTKVKLMLPSMKTPVYGYIKRYDSYNETYNWLVKYKDDKYLSGPHIELTHGHIGTELNHYSPFDWIVKMEET